MVSAKEDPIRPVAFVFLGLVAVVINEWLGIRPGGDRVGQVADGGGDRMTAAAAEFHQAGKGQGILVAGSGPIEVAVVVLDLRIDQFQQADLFLVEFLNDAGSNPHPLFDPRPPPQGGDNRQRRSPCEWEQAGNEPGRG